MMIIPKNKSTKRAKSLMLMLAFLITMTVGIGTTVYAETPEYDWQGQYEYNELEPDGSYDHNGENEWDNDIYYPILPEPEEPTEPYEPIEPEIPEELPIIPKLGSLVIMNLNQYYQPLPLAEFSLHHTNGSMPIIHLSTDIHGITEEIILPIGEYFIVGISPSLGYEPLLDWIFVSILENELTDIIVFSNPIQAQPEPTPEPTPEPNKPPYEPHGRLLITTRAIAEQGQGQGTLLSGAIFEVRYAMDNTLVAELISDHFGEAVVNLQSGDYFLRQIVPPRGFILNPDRISVRIINDRITEINITNHPMQEVNPQPTPSPPPVQEQERYGRLLITLRAQGTGEIISGATFEVRNIFDDMLITQLVTDQFGEATVNLASGDYFIRQLSTQAGFILNHDRLNFVISAGELRSITITNDHVPITNIVEEIPAEPEAYGRLLVTMLSGNTGERLQGASITVHELMTDNLIAELSTDSFGEASIFLPAGRYFMRQSNLPTGYILNMDRIPFTINSNDITDFSIVTRAVQSEPISNPTPTPTSMPVAVASPFTSISAPAIPPRLPEISHTEPDNSPNSYGRLEIITRAAQSGNPLSGGVFAVYRASNNRLISEITTDVDGMAYLELTTGGYFLQELRATFGFLLEPTRIFFEVKEGEIAVVEITKERDVTILDADTEGMIWIPQTGEFLSLPHYLGGAFMLVISVICGLLLARNRKLCTYPKNLLRKRAE